MKITFLGTSHGITEKNQFCSSALISTGGKHYLVDAGAPVLTLLKNQDIPLADMAGVFITHSHHDHFMGLCTLTQQINEFPQFAEVAFPYTYTGWQYAYDEKGNVTEKREYYEGILQSTVIYEYNGEELWSVYCVDPQDTLLYDCIVEDGVITEKVFYYADGNYDCSYRYEYDENGNLVKEYFLYDGEQLLVTTYSYKAVEVDAARAAYILKQQAYLIPIT